jgi:hypothetical protein
MTEGRKEGGDGLVNGNSGIRNAVMGKARVCAIPQQIDTVPTFEPIGAITIRPRLVPEFGREEVEILLFYGSMYSAL